jgi:sugar phosphate isomerase/epimerase
MAKFRLACHLIQFGGEQNENPEKVFREVAEAGWEAVEAVSTRSPDELVAMATLARRFGLHLVNVNAPGGQPTDAIQYNITLGNGAAEVPGRSRRDWGGDTPSDQDFERAARSLDEVLAFCDRHHIKGFHHAHLGTMIETVEDAERLLAAAPQLWLLFDTGHLLAAGSDPMQVFRSERLRKRIGHVHLKDCHADDPATWNHRTQRFGEKARFAELGAGNLGLDVPAVLKGLEEVGFDGWVAVELDRPYPPRPPAEAARVNREYLRKLGY